MSSPRNPRICVLPVLLVCWGLLLFSLPGCDSTVRGATEVPDATSDVGTDARGTANLWGQHEDKCAPKEAIAPRRTWQTPEPEAEPDEPPALTKSWSRGKDLCGIFNDRGFFPARNGGHAVLYDADIYGGKDVFVGVSHVHSDFALAPSPRGFVILDPATGKELDCVPFKSFWAEIGSSVTAVSALQRVYVPYSVLAAGESPAEQPSIGVVGLSFDGEAEIDFHFRKEHSAFVTPPKMAFIPNGQLVLETNVGQGLAVSLDARTGEVLWTVMRDELREAAGVESGTVSLLRPKAARSDTKVHFWAKVDGKRYSALVDRCGNLTLERTREAPMWVGDRNIHFAGDFSVVLEGPDGNEVWGEDQCKRPLTLTPGTFLCGKREWANSTGAPFVERDLEDGSRRTYRLNRKLGERVKVSAAPGRHLVTAGEATDDSGNLIIGNTDLDNSDQFERVVLEPPNNQIIDTDAQPPHILPDGTVIMLSWETIYGFETNLEGLAPGPYPRGIRGGNENRGRLRAPSR